MLEGSDDVLTMALGTPEHSGRVRGVGAGVTPSCYFNLPKNRRDTVKEIVSQLAEIYEAKTQELLRQERLQWQAKLDALMALIPGAKCPSTDGSAKASCSKEREPAAEESPAKKHSSANESCNKEGDNVGDDVHGARPDQKRDGVEEIEEEVVYKKVSN